MEDVDADCHCLLEERHFALPGQWIDPRVPLQTVEKLWRSFTRKRDSHRVTDHAVYGR